MPRGKPANCDYSRTLVLRFHPEITVDFAGTSRPETYLVEILPLIEAEPEGGAASPTWGEIRGSVTSTKPDGEAVTGPWIEITHNRPRVKAPIFAIGQKSRTEKG